VGDNFIKKNIIVATIIISSFENFR